jgi:hypothetical protein
MTSGAVAPALASLPILVVPTPRAPTALRCLKCHLSGRRSTLCFRAAVCAGLPRVFPLAYLLLAGWTALTVAFVLAIR